MQTARINYAILASQRSGSTLLCNLLAQTNIAGKPNEFFSHWEGRSHKAYDILDYPNYLEFCITDSMTSNSVFGVKAMTAGDGFSGVLARLESFPEYAHLSTPEKIRAVFPNINFIYLTRRHKVLQAISWWKAAQNGHFHTFVGNSSPDTPLEYNFDAITHLLEQLTMQECAHQEFLAMMKAKPLNIIYEDYIQDMEDTVAQIMNFLEIEDDYTFHPPQILKTGDAQSEAWAQRYREERQLDWDWKRW